MFFILGPTGVGKSKFSLEMAIKHKGQIINSDSLQMYRSVRIGTNQPSHKDLKRVPHHLFGFVEAGKQYTAGEFLKKTLKIIESETLKSPLFITGGSGFYVQALEKGMFSVPKVSKEMMDQLKDELNKKGHFFLYKELEKKDAKYAQKIHSKDTYRLLRTLSLIRTSGKSMSEIQKESSLKPLPFSFLKLALFLEKEELKQILLIRTKRMLESHFIEEVKNLIERGFSNWPVLKSVGYQECVDFLERGFSKNVLIEKILNRNLKLVKKQMTWFKRDPSICWFHAVREWDKASQWVENQMKQAYN